MKKLTIMLMLMLVCNAMTGQTAKSVLDKVAAVINNKGGISANFTMSGKQGGTSGTIAVKGQKFHAATPQAIVWFNGKTMWTYMKQNEEVNVSNPSAKEIQAINPYNVVGMYRNGYTYTMKTVGKSYQITLKATDKKRKVQEMVLLVNKSDYVLSQVKMRQGTTWSTINITNFKKSNLSDKVFSFNAKDYPKAEVVDLR